METETKKDKRLQYVSIILCWLVYTCSYLGKYSYNANISLIENDFSVSHTSAGLVLTLFALFYGAGQIVNGVFCKKFSKRFIIPLSLLISSLLNILLVFNIPFALIKYLWITDAIVLSVLWPITIQVISENISSKLLPKAILIMSTTTPAGTLLIYGISALNAGFGNYKLTFIVSAVILIIVGILWLLFYKKGNYLEKAKKEPNKAEKSVSAVSGLLFFLPFLFFGLLQILAAFLRDGLQSWAPVILNQLHRMPDDFSILLTLILPILGVIGSLAAVEVSKRIRTYILLTLAFFAGILIFSLIVVFYWDNLFVLVASFGILEFLIHGVTNVIVSIFPLAIRGKISSGMLSGILNGSSYAGTALSTVLLGVLADKSGWNAVFVALFIVAAAALLINFIYLLISKKNKSLEIRVDFWNN